MDWTQSLGIIQQGQFSKSDARAKASVIRVAYVNFKSSLFRNVQMGSYRNGQRPICISLLINMSFISKDNHSPVSPSWMTRVLTFTSSGYIIEINFSIRDSSRSSRNLLLKIAFFINFFVLQVSRNVNLLQLAGIESIMHLRIHICNIWF